MLYSAKKMTEIHMYVFENDSLIGAHYFLFFFKSGIKLKAASLPILFPDHSSMPRLLPLPGIQKEILSVSGQ